MKASKSLGHMQPPGPRPRAKNLLVLRQLRSCHSRGCRAPPKGSFPASKSHPNIALMPHGCGHGQDGLDLLLQAPMKKTTQCQPKLRFRVQVSRKPGCFFLCLDGPTSLPGVTYIPGEISKHIHAQVSI